MRANILIQTPKKRMGALHWAPSPSFILPPFLGPCVYVITYIYWTLCIQPRERLLLIHSFHYLTPKNPRKNNPVVGGLLHREPSSWVFGVLGRRITPKKQPCCWGITPWPSPSYTSTLLRSWVVHIHLLDSLHSTARTNDRFLIHLSFPYTQETTLWWGLHRAPSHSFTSTLLQTPKKRMGGITRAPSPLFIPPSWVLVTYID